MERDAAIIEVGLNESVFRHQNARVPYSPVECADDARRCIDAGAAVVHWHARDAVTGEQRLGDATLYGETLERIRPSGALAYPSYPIDTESLDGRLGHCWTLRERHGLELAPVDLGSVSVVLWDEGARSFWPGIERLPMGGVIANPLPFVLAALERITALGMVPSFGAFDLGFTRTLVLLAEAGLVKPPVFLKIFLSGTLAVGPFPTEEAIDFHLRQIPDGLDVEWVAVPYGIGDPALVERLCRHALARGGGVRVGVGDTPDAFPDATNSEIVATAARWAGDAGRPLAAPDDVRVRLGLGPAPPLG